MLVLSRKESESIFVGDNVVITVVEIRGDKVRLGINAPTDVVVDRQEVREAKLRDEPKRSLQQKGPAEHAKHS